MKIGYARIREGKKIPFSNERLANYRSPKTPRRVPVSIRYGYVINKPDEYIISVYVGVQLSHQEIKTKKVTAVKKVTNYRSP